MHGFQLRKIDFGILAGFLLFAVLHFLGVWRGIFPYPFLTSDPGDICGYVSGFEHPELFTTDELLRDPSNFTFYASLQVPLLRYLTRLTGDCGFATMALTAPIVFLQLAGFYLLGVVLFQNRWFAFLLAAQTTATVGMNLGEFWGIQYDPMPRMVFQCLLPFLLTLAIVWRGEPRRWIWLMAACAFLIHIHGVSTPAWAFAVWLGLALYLPSEWSRTKSGGVLFALGVAFLAMSSPFLSTYLHEHEHGAVAHYQEIYELFREMWHRDFLDPFYATGQYLIRLNETYLLWGIGVSIPLVLLLERDSRLVSLVLVWIAGLLLVAVGFTYVVLKAAASMQALPVQIDLIRCLRYITPLCMLFVMWALSLLARRCEGSTVMRYVPAFLGIICLVALPPYTDFSNAALGSWMKGKLYPSATADQQADLQFLKTIDARTPVGARLLVVGRLDPLPLRYTTFRPVVYARKDGGALAYGNVEHLMQWQEIRRAYNALPEGEARSREAFKLAERLADFLIFEWRTPFDGPDPSFADRTVASQSFIDSNGVKVGRVLVRVS